MFLEFLSMWYFFKQGFMYKSISHNFTFNACLFPVTRLSSTQYFTDCFYTRESFLIRSLLLLGWLGASDDAVAAGRFHEWLTEGGVLDGNDIGLSKIVGIASCFSLLWFLISIIDVRAESGSKQMSVKCLLHRTQCSLGPLCWALVLLLLVCFTHFLT